MSILIKNTLSGAKEVFVPREDGKVKIYVCGVTVYDDIHMGHARSMIVFDTIVRYLRHCGYDVTHVTNFTDVDDKIIRKAAEEGVGALELSARYIGHYFEDATKLGIRAVPTALLVDKRGIVRETNLLGKPLIDAARALLAER